MIRSYFKIYLLMAVVSGTLLFPSCKKGYLDVNQEDPNLTDKPPVDALMAGVTYQTGVNVFNAGNITSYYVQQLASPNVGSGSDVYDDVDRSTTWKNLYYTAADARQLSQLAATRNAYEHVGVAKVTEAINMSILIDLFGDVPYTQAFNKELFTPTYDGAEAVYDSCLLLIDQGIASLNQADPAIALNGDNDLIHGGAADEKAAWIKTAYALKARLLNRLSKTAEYDPEAILAALGQAYTSNSDDAQVTRFEGRSLWNEVAQNNANLSLDGWLSSTFVNALNGATYGVVDPRLKYIANLTRFGDYRGTRNGAGRVGTGTDDDESYLSVNGYYSRPGAPLLLITYAEMKFIESEAAFATDKERSYQAYLDGISANMSKTGVPDVERNAYINNPAVAVGAPAFTRALLFKEKYVATFLQPETWTDARRFDYQYKDFTLPVGALLDTYIRRIGYPTTEISRNAANIPAVNSLADRLWWDQ